MFCGLKLPFFPFRKRPSPENDDAQGLEGTDPLPKDGGPNDASVGQASDRSVQPALEGPSGKDPLPGNGGPNDADVGLASDRSALQRLEGPADRDISNMELTVHKMARKSFHQGFSRIV